MTKSDLDINPIVQFSIWFEEAKETEILQPEAMTLATVSSKGRPAARMVLLKEFGETGFLFFTNYTSRKGRELIAIPHAALLFFWPELQRQVRIEGRVIRATPEESQTYFNSRPRESRLSAWASHQSAELKSRIELERRVAQYQEKFTAKPVPCPPFWGGYRVIPGSMEFWQGQRNRLHDRFLYQREKTGWQIVRLAP